MNLEKLSTLFKFRRRESSQPTLHCQCEPHDQTRPEKIPFVNNLKPGKAALGHPSDVRQLAANTLGFGISLVEQIADCVPVPGLRGAIGGVNLILTRFDGAVQNLHGFDDIIASIDGMNHILSMFEDESSIGRVLTDDLGEELFMLSGKLAEVRQEVKRVKRHSKLRRMIEAPSDAQSLIQQFRQLQGFINEIVVGSALKTEIRLADLYALEHLDKLPRAKDARHDYVNRPMCSEGTREDVLKQILNWVYNEKGQQIYWLNGGAGTGKTTIAMTIADMVSKDPTIFSASFFCSRRTEGRSDAKLIFPSLAYSFARRDMRLRNMIIQVINDSPDIGHALSGEQVSRLLIGPLRRQGPRRPVLLILDALDECTGGRAPEEILTALASEIQSVPFLKVFVSSRPTAATNDAFADEGLRQRREVFVLHDVENDVVDADIRDYMIERLTKMAARRRLNVSPWPPPELMDKLVRMAGGLFIFASTLCEFIEARGDLEFRLKEIAARPTNEYTGIDDLYREIVEYAISQFPDRQTIDHCRLIIGTTVLLQVPLSPHDLGQILHLPPKHIRGILGDFQAVLLVPDELEGSIRILHASFQDFIATQGRCLPVMYLEPTLQHRVVTLRLLEIMMEGLKRNMSYLICFKLGGEEDLPSLLRYACRYWADHLSCATVQDADDLVQALSCFVSKKLAYCLEVLDSTSKTEDLSNATMKKVEVWLAGVSESPQRLTESPQSIIQMFHQARSFAREDMPEPTLFSLFGLSPDTRYAQRGHGRLCSEGTRNEVLEDILTWVNDDETTQLYWLDGVAGCGKTTIAMTIADLVGMDRSKIAATFFCSRYSRYRSNVQHVFVTLSIILAMHDASFRVQLIRAVGENPDVIRMELEEQFRILITEPLGMAGSPHKSVVFVIDAINEFVEEAAPRKILSAFAKHLHDVPFLKVLISTRPSPHVLTALRRIPITRTKYCLHNIDRAVVDRDIERYLFDALRTYASIVERLSMSWPPKRLLDKLVVKAGGLFVYASFICEQFRLLGTDKLEEMANQCGSEYEGNLGLNRFYGRILKPLLLVCGEESESQWRNILGILAHLAEPIPVEGFRRLVGISRQDLYERLLELQSIVVVSGVVSLIKPIHPSLRDWLTDSKRALPSLLVEPTVVHREIALRLLDCLLRDLDHTSGYSTPLVERDALLSDSMGAGLVSYACRYWAAHLSRACADDHLQTQLEIFLEMKLMVWIERLDCSRELMLAAKALGDAKIWYHEVTEPRHEIIKIFFDAHQSIIGRSMVTLESFH